MSQTFIGIDYEGVPSVKISIDSHDPATTPDTVYGAFLYNSKFDPIRYWGAVTISDAGNAPLSQYFPAGTNKNNYQLLISKPSTTSYWFRNSYFAGLHYSQPVFQQKRKTFSGRYSGKVVQQPFGFESRSGYFASSGAWSDPWYANYNNFAFNDVGYVGYGTTAQPNYASNGSPESNMVLEVWDLPGNADPILDPPRAPVSGQTSIFIDSTTCRVAKPGYDVWAATETQLAFDSAILPIKVVAANDVAVPTGISWINVGAIPDDCLIDVHFYAGGEIYYPISPLIGGNASLGAEYWLANGQLIFDNPYGACRARFMIYSKNGAGPTYGANDVLRHLHDGVRNVTQFLRPGCGPNPSFADIILDSRWPAVRIIREGYIPITADGAQQWPVAFDAGGAWPFVKYMTEHGAHSSSEHSYSSAVREPYSKILYTNGIGSFGGTAGDTSYCRLTGSEARFFTFRGAPVRNYYADAQAYSANRLSQTYDESPIVGIRYYIFGIPQP
ncbi:hypothetical protein [Martelella limonii]|uniref:hypothetical protein n=1 Tax=Martelella limonii TaxID=1647649 RepID=UPI0015800990|nr:hypothetical protein [Martelella limonii]